LRKFINTLLQKYEFVSIGDVEADDDILLFSDKTSAINFLRNFTDDIFCASVFREVLLKKFSRLTLSRMKNSTIVDYLAEELANGQIKILRKKPIVKLGVWQERKIIEQQRDKEDIESIAAMDDDKSWIEILLVNTSNQPVADEQFHIHLPDGTEKQGKTNSMGVARFNGVDPGTCHITFPQKDKETWGMA